MNDYIVRAGYLKPSKIKGELPDVINTYISAGSSIGFHYEITSEREKAYIFDESEMKEAKFIADCWGMKLMELD